MRMAIRADVNRQPGPYMWVQLAESPLGLGQLYVRKPLQRKRKVEIYGKVGGKLKKFGFLETPTRVPQLDVSFAFTSSEK